MEDRMTVLTKQLTGMRETIIQESKKEINKRVKGDIISMSGDDGDLSVASADNEIRISKLSSKHTALSRIDEALRKIQEGTYGRCNECDEEIPTKRLKAMPFAVSCVSCQEATEKLEKIERMSVRDE